MGCQNYCFILPHFVIKLTEYEIHYTFFCYTVVFSIRHANPPKQEKDSSLFHLPLSVSCIKGQNSPAQHSLSFDRWKIACVSRMLIMVQATLSTASTCPKATLFFFKIQWNIDIFMWLKPFMWKPLINISQSNLQLQYFSWNNVAS